MGAYKYLLRTRTSPLGLLGRLPREIRNVVYEHVFMPSYQVIFADLDEEPWRIDVTLKILSTSKAVHEEARAVLYKHSTIVFSYKEWVNAAQPSESAIELSETGFKRVEIRMDNCMGPETSIEASHFLSMPRFSKMFMDQLAGLSTSQKELTTVTMRLDPENCSHQVLDLFLELWYDQPLTTSLGKLTEFRSVVIEWHESCGCITLHKPSKKYTRKPCAHVAERIKVPISPLWERLDETLGPKTTEQIILWDKRDRLPTVRAVMRFRNCHVRRWIYRPRAFSNGHTMDDSQIPDRVCYGYADCNHSFKTPDMHRGTH